jgi:hypothetical protein
MAAVASRIRRKYPLAVDPADIALNLKTPDSNLKRAFALKLAKLMRDNGITQLERGENTIPPTSQINRMSAKDHEQFVFRALKVIENLPNKNQREIYGVMLAQSRLVFPEKRGRPGETQRQLQAALVLESQTESQSEASDIFDERPRAAVSGVRPGRLAEAVIRGDMPFSRERLLPGGDKQLVLQSSEARPVDLPKTLQSLTPPLKSRLVGNASPYMSASEVSIADMATGESIMSKGRPLRIRFLSDSEFSTDESITPSEILRVGRGKDPSLVAFIKEIVRDNAHEFEIDYMMEIYHALRESHDIQETLEDNAFLINSALQDPKAGISRMLERIAGTNLDKTPAMQASMLPTDPLVDEFSRDNIDRMRAEPLTTSGERPSQSSVVSSSIPSQPQPDLSEQKESPVDIADEKTDPLLGSRPSAGRDNALSRITPQEAQEKGYTREQLTDASNRFRQAEAGIQDISGRVRDNPFFREVAEQKYGYSPEDMEHMARAAEWGARSAGDLVDNVGEVAVDPRRQLAETGATLADNMARRVVDSQVPGLYDTVKEFAGRANIGTFEDMEGVLRQGVDIARRGGFSRGPGGVGNLPNPQAHEELKEIDTDRDGRVSRRERREAPKNHGIRFVERFNPEAAGRLRHPTEAEAMARERRRAMAFGLRKQPRKGELRIAREPIIPISTKKARNQVKLVQKAVAGYKERRDIFQTSFK